MGDCVAITVDLELFDEPFLFRGRATPPNGVEDIGVEGVWFVADLLEEFGCRGTFFVLGEVAEERPAMVRELVDRGHEVASHGYSKSHPDLRDLDHNTLEQEISRCKEAIEGIINEPIAGFRAPAYAVDGDVLAVVEESGHLYDSSVVPGRRIPGFYGGVDAPMVPFSTEDVYDGSTLCELPVSVAPLLKTPISGAWMRLFGRRYARWGLSNRVDELGYAMIYVHPWELVDLPRYDALPRRIYWRTGQYTQRTLRCMVETFADAIVPAKDIAAAEG